MDREPEEYSFSRYLAAKAGLDDRSLNRQVREALAGRFRERGKPSPFRVLEVGCGIGTMLERLLDWRLLDLSSGDFAYTGIDLEAGLLDAARARYQNYVAARGAAPDRESGCLPDCQGPRPLAKIAVTFEALDLFRFLAREQDRRRWDLIVAHAFLDLVDLETTLPGLLSLLAPGGCFYFTLNFDGTTLFEPVIDPELDRLIEARYHHSMDQRRVRGRPSGSSQTGRRLFAQLAAAGGTVLAAGASDWLVFPGPDGYPGDEAYFLSFILYTVEQALEGDPLLPAADFQDWLAHRRQQVERRQLVYRASQLDFFGQV
ncbi:MAG: class I SAM-dependent methyltransferase [Desulfobaccales bacterium]